MYVDMVFNALEEDTIAFDWKAAGANRDFFVGTSKNHDKIGLKVEVIGNRPLEELSTYTERGNQREMMELVAPIIHIQNWTFGGVPCIIAIMPVANSLIEAWQTLWDLPLTMGNVRLIMKCYGQVMNMLVQTIRKQRRVQDAGFQNLGWMGNIELPNSHPVWIDFEHAQPVPVPQTQPLHKFNFEMKRALAPLHSQFKIWDHGVLAVGSS